MCPLRWDKLFIITHVYVQDHIFIFPHCEQIWTLQKIKEGIINPRLKYWNLIKWIFTVCIQREDFEYLKSKYIKLTRMDFHINLYFWILTGNSVALYYWNKISYIPPKRDWESHGNICLRWLWPPLHDIARWQMAYVYSLIYFLVQAFKYTDTAQMFRLIFVYHFIKLWTLGRHRPWFSPLYQDIYQNAVT